MLKYTSSQCRTRPRSPSPSSASATGKASSALRYYEREHLLQPSGRRSGRRVYPVRSVEQVALIDLLQVAGLTIGEIRAIVSPSGTFADDWRDQARAARSSASSDSSAN